MLSTLLIVLSSDEGVIPASIGSGCLVWEHGAECLCFPSVRSPYAQAHTGSLSHGVTLCEWRFGMSWRGNRLSSRLFVVSLGSVYGGGPSTLHQSVLVVVKNTRRGTNRYCTHGTDALPNDVVNMFWPVRWSTGMNADRQSWTLNLIKIYR